MPSLYFLIMYYSADPGRDFGLVKVGITDGDVADRIAQLQTGNPYELRCVADFDSPHARSVEHFVHRAHAADMHQLEWLRCGREDAGIVDEAEGRSAPYRSHQGEGGAHRRARLQRQGVRRPTPDETELHRAAASLMKDSATAELRLEAADGWLHAATATTLGIPGRGASDACSDSTSRFNPRRAEETHPHLAERFQAERTTGSFRWRKVPVAWHFPWSRTRPLRRRRRPRRAPRAPSCHRAWRSMGGRRGLPRSSGSTTSSWSRPSSSPDSGPTSRSSRRS